MPDTTTEHFSARKPMLVANWKMHGNRALLDDFAKQITGIPSTLDVVLAPPTPLLDYARQTLNTHWALAAQDCHWAQEGAYTGETSAKIIQELGCSFVLIGHSERRTLMGETDEYVHDKIIAALETGLTPIVCIGETLTQYQAQETFITLASQLFHGLPKITNSQDVVIAYEPVWAIGSGVTPSPKEVNDAHDHIRTFLCTHWDADKGKATRILYGGSVKPDTAKDILSLPDVDGVLVGGASLQPENWNAIVQAADSI